MVFDKVNQIRQSAIQDNCVFLKYFIATLKVQIFIKYVTKYSKKYIKG